MVDKKEIKQTNPYFYALLTLVVVIVLVLIAFVVVNSKGKSNGILEALQNPKFSLVPLK